MSAQTASVVLVNMVLTAVIIQRVILKYMFIHKAPRMQEFYLHDPASKNIRKHACYMLNMLQSLF